MNSPAAYYDCLSIGKKLANHLNNFTSAELHLFSYLSCLLSLYKKKSVSDWGYIFAGTEEGSPFSADIHSSIVLLVRVGCFKQEGNYYTITEKGVAQLNSLSILHLNQQRLEFHEAACSSLLSLPIGVIREALFNEPEIRRAMQLSSSRILLEGPGIEVIYGQFGELSEAIGVEINDLLMPSILWLTYLAQLSLEQQANRDGETE